MSALGNGGSSHWGPSGKPCGLSSESCYQRMEAWGIYPWTPIPLWPKAAPGAITTMAVTQVTHAHGTSSRGALRRSSIYQRAPNHSCRPAQMGQLAWLPQELLSNRERCGQN